MTICTSHNISTIYSNFCIPTTLIEWTYPKRACVLPKMVISTHWCLNMQTLHPQVYRMWNMIVRAQNSHQSFETWVFEIYNCDFFAFWARDHMLAVNCQAMTCIHGRSSSVHHWICHETTSWIMWQCSKCGQNAKYIDSTARTLCPEHLKITKMIVKFGLCGMMCFIILSFPSYRKDYTLL